MRTRDGLPEPDLTLLEYAALLHDIGRLSPREPIEGGATEPLEPAERRGIARLGAAVVRRTEVPEEVAAAVERQAGPYREQPVTARIVRTANACEEPTAPGTPRRRNRPRRRRSGCGAPARDHDPRVVEALSRVLARRAASRSESAQSPMTDG
ncbi:HD domain-containing protein [Streptomyces macrosporus]|uniref:HD domain-containing protein n=1 Tax=Streptomyces macrosporus TaxID=44032 RepID=A0ABN3KLL6_9ACTN